MRKYYIMMLISSLYVAFAMLSSCDKEDTRPDDMKRDFAEAAVMHTEAMEVCLEAIRKADTNDPATILKVVEETATRYVVHNPELSQYQNLGEKALKDEIKRLYAFRKMVKDPTYKGEYTYNDFLLYTVHGHLEDLSEAQYNLLLTVNDIMFSNNTADAIVPMLTQILDVDCLTLPEEERYVLYAVTTVGIETVNYWSENMYDWIEAITDGDPDKMANMSKWFNWGSVASSDIAGAIGGAIGGAITGSFAGGIGAGPGALAGGIGGAVGVSVTDASMQVIDHFF